MPYLIGLAIIVGVPVALVQHLTGLSAGYAVAATAALVALGVICMILLAKQRRAQRRAALIAKYGSPDEADMILEHRIWTGMTSEQLLDSAGRPEGVDQEVMKRKSREIWKYDRIGENRYRNRVTVEQGQVVAWTAKGR